MFHDAWLAKNWSTNATWPIRWCFISTVSSTGRCVNTVHIRVIFTCDGKCISFCEKCLIFFWDCWIYKNWYISHRLHVCACTNKSVNWNCANLLTFDVDIILQQRINFQTSDPGILMTSKGMYDLYAKRKLNQESWWWQTNKTSGDEFFTMSVLWIFPFLKGQIKVNLKNEHNYSNLAQSQMVF